MRRNRLYFPLESALLHDDKPQPFLLYFYMHWYFLFLCTSFNPVAHTGRSLYVLLTTGLLKRALIIFY